MYTKISKFDLSKLTNVEFLQMMKSIKAHVERFGADVLGISLFFDFFVTLLNKALEAFETERSSAYSQAIDESDRLRDNDYRVLYYFVKAFTFSSNSDLKHAADQLMRVFKDGESPLTASLDVESILLANVVSKLRSEAYSGYVELLKATSLLDDIAKSNNEFGKLDLSRTDERSKKPDGGMKNFRLQLNPLYANIRGTVNTLAAGNPASTELDEFTNLVETEVKHYRGLVAQRETRRKNGKKP